jgi:hypothetical protein
MVSMDEMDAAISPGSSGGPVVNQHGEVVGIAVSSLVEGQNLNFAVPVRYLREQKLAWDLRVKTVGGLVVTDLEENGFHGPVRTVTESYAGYTFNEAKNTYVEGPAELLASSRYNRDGRLEETTNFENGVETLRNLWEYSDDGLKRRNTFTTRQERLGPEEISPALAVNMNDPFAIEQLEEMGVESVHDIPADFELSEIQRRACDTMQTGQPWFSADLKGEFESLKYPLCFMDFETVNPAIPRFRGMHPYDHCLSVVGACADATGSSP